MDYANNRNFDEPVSLNDEELFPNPAAGDLGPEGLIFIKEENSPNGKPLVVVGNEVSGTTTIYEVQRVP